MSWVTEAAQQWALRDQRTASWAAGLNISPGAHKNALTLRLQRLAGFDRCSANAVGWVKTSHDGTSASVTLSEHADARTPRGHPAVALRGLDHLDGAVLTFVVCVQKRSNALLAYSIGLTGTADGRPWTARFDLTDAPAGAGPCGHPLLHLHVGDPEAPLQARAPAQHLSPAEALDWLLATVDPALEPRS